MVHIGFTIQVALKLCCGCSRGSEQCKPEPEGAYPQTPVIQGSMTRVVPSSIDSVRFEGAGRVGFTTSHYQASSAQTCQNTKLANNSLFLSLLIS